MTQRVRIQNFTVSRDGIGAGQEQSLEHPFGHADPMDLHGRAVAIAHWPGRTDPGGSRGLEDYLTRDFARNIGAEIMGRNTFGPQRGAWADEGWTGGWGENPPRTNTGAKVRTPCGAAIAAEVSSVKIETQ